MDNDATYSMISNSLSRQYLDARSLIVAIALSSEAEQAASHMLAVLLLRMNNDMLDPMDQFEHTVTTILHRLRGLVPAAIGLEDRVVTCSPTQRCE